MFRNKYKPAIQGLSNIDVSLLTEDYKAAMEYGLIRVGKHAMFIEDVNTEYIPLEDLARMDLTVERSSRGTCCGLVNVTAHEVTIVTQNGGIKKMRVINIDKTQAALEVVKTANPLVEITCTEID